jgi:hypothetical protein
VTPRRAHTSAECPPTRRTLRALRACASLTGPCRACSSCTLRASPSSCQSHCEAWRQFRGMLKLRELASSRSFTGVLWLVRTAIVL